ncbi:MAG: NAD kinase [Flavobacteriaceae bacterium]
MKIALYGQHYKKEASKYIDILLLELNNNNIDVLIESDFYKLIKKRNNPSKEYRTFKSHKSLNNSFDALFTVGGDGTFLRSITYVRNHDIPILGINIGRLGFLANVQKGKIKDAIKAVVNNKYSIKERALLQVTTEPKMTGFNDLNIALNEVTVVRKDSTAMITVETHLDHEFLTSYWADGLIVATPTGSTGYSLSCGGPVITPSAKNIVLTPIAPHNLNARPLVIPDDTKIQLKVIGREKHALLSLDSRIITIPNNAVISIEKCDFNIKTINLNNQTFLKTLRKKLLWGEDVRNK